MKRSVFARLVAPAALAVAATVAIWAPGSPARQESSSRDLAWLDRAIETRGAAPVPPAPPVAAPDRAKLPRATGVANGSYDTKIEGDTFVFGSPASAETKFNLRFGPVVVTSSGVVLSGGNTGDYDVANGGFEAKRGEIAERYMYDNSRVEQFFVIPTKPETAGAIEVASPIGMPPATKVEVVGYGWHDARFAKGGLRVLDDAGSEVAAIYGARVVDADGRQLDLAMGYENGAMTMTVPASFVAIATFPITVDPWIELAGSGTVAGIPGDPANLGTPDGVSMTLTGSNMPVVAWCNADATPDVCVSVYNPGTATWLGLAGSTTATGISGGGASFYPTVACPTTLNPAVAWQTGADQIFFRRWNGVSWEDLAGSGAAHIGTLGVPSSTPSLALDASGNPCIAWLGDEGAGSFGIRLRLWNPSTAAWVELGGSDGLAGSGGLSGLITASVGTDKPSVAIDPMGRPVVAWTSAFAGGVQVYLRRYNPTSGGWDALGASATAGTGLSALAAGFDDAQDPQVAFNSLGEPMVAWSSLGTGGAREIFLRSFNPFTAAWDEFAGSGTADGLSGTAGGISETPALKCNASGIPTVVWRETVGALEHIYARRLQSGVWVELAGSGSTTGISGALGDAIETALAIRTDGYPAAAWLGSTTGTKHYREYNGLEVPIAAAQRQTASPFLAIPLTGSSSTSSVRLDATLSVMIPSTARLQFEVQPNATAFTDVPTAETSLLAAGSTGAVVIPLTPGLYKWQYRAQAADPSITSAWTAFDPAPAVDFEVGTAPAAPVFTELTQHELVSGALLVDGGSTLEGGIIFRYTPGVALTEALRLQVDFTADGIPDVESPLSLATPASPISISVPLPLGGYDWTARLQNAAGVSSSFTAFETGGGTDFTVAAAPAPPTPGDPTALGQFRLDGTTVIPAAGTTPEGAVVLRATTPAGAPGELFRVQFEVAPTGGLTGIPDAESVLVPPSTIVSVTLPLTDGAFEWQARSISSFLVTSAPFVLFGGAGLDFNVDSPFVGTPPGSPTTPGQFFLDGTTPIGSGGATLEGAVVFRATLPASTDMVRLQLEVQTEPGVFTDFPDAESALLPGGTTIDITFPVGIGSFKWQVRTVSSALAASAWIPFPGGPVDFTSPATPTVPPTAPLAGGLAQRNLDGTLIASGGTAFSELVLFEAVVPGLVTEVNRIQFDIELIGVGPDGVPDIESPLAAGGSTVSVPVPLGVGSYMWSARAIGPTGLTSAWTTFGGVFGTDFIVTVGSSIPPTGPVTLGQENLDGTTIGSGGTAAGNSVVFEVVVPGAAVELNRIQVDVEAGLLDLQPDGESPLVAGGTTVQIVLPFGVGSYNWAVRTQSSLGLNSAWVALPGGPADFVIATGGSTPAAPSTLAQLNPDASPIAPVGATAAGSIVVFQVIVPGLATDLNRVQVDVELAGTLDFIPDVESALVAGGTTVSISVPFADGTYDWQVRTQSAGGANSAFTAFAAASPDFVISTGVTPPAAPAAPVTLSQLNIDGTAIGLGLTASGGSVAFQVVVPGAPGDLNRIQVSYAAGVPDLTPELESPLVPFPSTVTMTAPLAPGSYNWQARTVSSFNLFSAYTSFSASSPDFIVAVGGLPPTAPVAGLMDQQNPDGSSIVSGATAAGSIVVFEVTVPGAATDLNRIQVDVEVGGLDSIPDVESPIVVGGTVVTISVPLANGLYDWQARTQSSAGAVSAYTAFTGGPSDFEIDTTTPAPPTPPVPATLVQRNLNGTLIGLGSTAVGNTVSFEVVVPGLLPTDQNRIQVSYAIGIPDATPELESPLVLTGSTVTMTVPLGVGAYNWQARTQSSFGVNSAYTAFDASSPDFVIATGGVAPTAPLVAGMDQQNPDATSIGSGATAAGSIVVFAVTVPGAATDLNRVQVDVESAGLDGIPDVESSLVPGGTLVTISVPLANGLYDWQARTQSSTGAVSGYTLFPGGPADFEIDTTVPPPVAPAAPATLAQRNLDGTLIALAGTASVNTVRFEVLVPGAPGDMNRIQVSYAIGAPDTTPEVESPLVLAGSTVTMTVPLAVGAYNWQARTQSSFGLESGYTAFDASTPDFVVVTGGASPAAPLAAGMDQQNPDGSSIGSGATAAGSIVVFEVTVPGAATDLNRVQIDFETTGLDGVPDLEGPLVTGGTTVTIGVSLANGLYDWQARTQSSTGAVSGYTAFPGGPSDFEIDTTVPPPVAPAAPVTLTQRNLDGTVIALAGTATGNTVRFEALVPGAPGDMNRIQVSYAIGAPDTTPEVESPLVLAGSTVTMTVPLGVGSYNWQARTQSSVGLSSGYTAFDASTPDFVVATGGAAPGAPLAAGMDQQNPDTSSIGTGATAAGSIVVFVVTVPGVAADLNRVQVDVESTGLDGIPDVESSLVPGGTVVSISVPLADGLYDWQVRTQSSAGAVSGYTAFPGGPSDFVVDTTTPAPVPPGAPVALSMDQLNLDGTSIAPSGGTALSNLVVFEVAVPGVPADLNRIQVDVEATGALDGVVNFESPLVPGGTTVTIQASFANGSYEWQARTQSSMMANSAFTAFTGGPDDFVVAQGGPVPPVSSGLTQTNSDGSVIGSGATTATGTVVFGGTVSTTPAGGSARLQVEFSTGGFTGVPDVESPLVPDGTAVSISVPMADGSYSWQARTQSSAGAVSAYTAFAGGPPDFVVAVGGGGVPPSVPTGLDQQNLDTTSIPAAGAATGSTVVFEAIVGGTPGSLNRLQVEFNPTGPGFTAVPDVESPLVTAGSVVHIAVPHSPGTFQWQARTQSSMGAVSAFVEFAAGGVTDYIVTSIAGGPAPAFPIALTQLELDGVTGIAPGGTTTEPVVVFRATLPGAAVDLNRLQVEYLPSVAALFTGNPTVESPLVPGGATISIVAPIADGSWQWRARSQSSSTAVSTWVDFGGAAPGVDFIVNTVGVVPPAPAGLAQQNADTSSIAPGGTAVTDVVRFGATVTSTTGEEVSLQVDFAPVGGLSGTPDIESPLVPPGSLVFISIPLGDGSYEWQARTRSASGAVSTYTPFGGTSGVTADFIVAAGAGGIAPGVPTGITQRRLDGTVIASGGTTSGDTVVFEGTVSGPPASFLRLEVEFALFGTGLAGVPDIESPLVPTGSTVQIAVSLGDGSYEWQARARTSTGAVSAFSPAFGTSGVTADFVVAAGSGGVPPAPPSGIGQFRIDGVSAIPTGGIVTDDKLIFRGTVAGLITNLFRFQVEYVDAAGAFTGNPTVESPLVPGSSLVSISVPIGDGSYMWRARSQSSTGASSGWVDFALAAGTDFTIASSGLTPPPPLGLAQETLSGAPIPGGGTTFSDTVVFRGTVTSSPPGGLVSLQVEFSPPSSLGGIPDVASPLVPSGTSVTIAVPLGDGVYEWQARTVSPTGLASAFVPFGGTTGVTDFIV